MQNSAFFVVGVTDFHFSTEFSWLSTATFPRRSTIEPIRLAFASKELFDC